MAQIRKPWKDIETRDETDALLFENAELRKTAAELLVQTAILREALMSDRTKPGFD